MEELEGKIALVGFDKLEEQELETAKKIVLTHLKMLSEKTDFQELRIELKRHKRGKKFLYEMNAQAFVDNKRIGARETAWDLYKCLNSLLGKIISGAMHRKRIVEEIGEIMKRRSKLSEF